MFDITKEYTSKIVNDRTDSTILNHAYDEYNELSDEVWLKANGRTPGEDGIIGESVDVILCMMDLIHRNYPQLTEEEFNTVVKKKLDKWYRKYHNGNTTS